MFLKTITTQNLPEYWFSLNHLFPYKDRIIDSVLIRENIDQSTPVFWHLQKYSFANVLQNSYSYYFHKFGRKSFVLESPFNKVAGNFQQRCCPVKFAKFLRHLFLQNTFAGCFFVFYAVHEKMIKKVFGQ